MQCTGLSLVEVRPSEASERARVCVRIGTSVEVDFCEPVCLRELALFCREVGRC